MKELASRFKLQASSKIQLILSNVRLATRSSQLAAGFTLVETLVAVSLLSIAITAPMSLTSKSLTTAYYARDQVTAFHLAQEAVETIRHVRDNNILKNAFGTYAPILEGIPATDGSPFVVDTRNNAMTLCTDTVAYPPDGCPPLSSDGSLYGYPIGGEQTCTSGVVSGTGGCWGASNFTRTVRTLAGISGNPDEIRISVDVAWKTGSLTPHFTISENLYRWVQEATP